MFVCAFHQEISSFFKYEFPLSFPIFVNYIMVNEGFAHVHVFLNNSAATVDSGSGVEYTHTLLV